MKVLSLSCTKAHDVPWDKPLSLSQFLNQKNSDIRDLLHKEVRANTMKQFAN